MKLFKFKQKKTDILEKKYYGVSNSQFLFYEKGEVLVGSPKTFLDYYSYIAPFQTAVDVIAKEIQSLPIKIWDKLKEKWLDKHPFYDLLDKPNNYQNGNQFLAYLARHYVITGNAYIMLGGLDINKEPVALYGINPAMVACQQNTLTGFVKEYTVNNITQTSFNENEVSGRYYNSQGELIHLKYFNSNVGTEYLYGMSIFESCQEQLETYKEIGLNNRGLLKNGMRPSALIHFNGSMDDESFTAMQQGIKNKYTGSSNAGKPILTTAEAKLEYQELSKSTKDLDFPTLLTKAEEAIYQKAGIPLDFIKGNSTYTNKENAKYELYDNCVFPLAKSITTFLTNRILQTRYKDGENLELKIDTASIECLTQRTQLNATQLYKDGIITRNEARTKVGLDQSPKDGDVFNKDSNTQENTKSFSPELATTLKEAGYTVEDIKSLLEE